MARRMIDTDFWNRPEVRALKAPYKLLWSYLNCSCDHAGIWTVELDVAALRLGVKLDREEALSQFGALVEDLGRVWVVIPFVSDQYGELNPANKVHASVIQRLRGARDEFKNKGLYKGLPSPLEDAKDKDKDKDKLREEVRMRDEGFAKLWEIFEGHGSKPSAAAYWARLSPTDREAILTIAPTYVRAHSGERQQFRKYLEGWINPAKRLWERPFNGMDAPPTPQEPRYTIPAGLKPPPMFPVTTSNGHE